MRAQVDQAIERYVASPGDAGALQILLEARRRVARYWAGLSAEQVEVAYTQEIGRVYQASMEFRVGHFLPAELRAPNIYHNPTGFWEPRLAAKQS